MTGHLNAVQTLAQIRADASAPTGRRRRRWRDHGLGADRRPHQRRALGNVPGPGRGAQSGQGPGRRRANRRTVHPHQRRRRRRHRRSPCPRRDGQTVDGNQSTPIGRHDGPVYGALRDSPRRADHRRKRRGERRGPLLGSPRGCAVGLRSASATRSPPSGSTMVLACINVPNEAPMLVTAGEGREIRLWRIEATATEGLSVTQTGSFSGAPGAGSHAWPYSTARSSSAGRQRKR